MATAFLLVAGTGIVRLMHSRPVTAATIHWLETTASALGARIEVGDLRWSLLPPSIHLDRVRLSSSGLELEAATVSASLADIRLTRSEIELGDLIVRHAHLRWRGDLPDVGQSSNDRMRLHIQRLDLREISFDGALTDARLRLQMDDVDAGWVREASESRGYVLAPRVRFEAPGIEPVEAAIRARVILGETVRVPLIAITGYGYSFEGDGEVLGSLARFDLTGKVDLAELDRIVHAGDVLDGEIELSATVDSSSPTPARLDIRGDDVTAAGFVFQDMAGTVAVGPAGLDGHLERARLAGGEIAGDYHLRPLGPPYDHRVHLDADAVRLATILEILGVPPAGLAARTRIGAELAWTGMDLAHGVGHGTADFRPTTGVLPTSGTLEVDLLPDGLLHFKTNGLHIGGSTLDWQGPLIVGSWEPAWSIRAAPAILEEVVPLVNRFAGEDILPEIVAGRGVLAVGLAGPWHSLVVNTRLDAAPFTLDTVTFDRVVGEATVSGDTLTVGPVRFRVGEGDGEVGGTLTWSDDVAPADRLDLELRGQQIPLARFASWAGVEDGVSGRLSFTGGLRGDPVSPRGSWAIGLANVNVAGQPLGDAAGTLDLSDGTFVARGLTFDLGLEGDLSWRTRDRWVGANLAWKRMPLELLGTTFAPTLGDWADAELRLSWPLDGVPTGTLSMAAEGGRLIIDADQQKIDVNATLEGTAHGDLELVRGSDGNLHGTGTATLDDAQELVARLVPEANVPLEGTASGTFEVDWPAGGRPSLDGTVAALNLELDGRPIHLADPARFTIDSHQLRLDRLYLAAAEEKVFLRGTMDADGAVRGNLSGTLDALLLRFLIPEWEPSGRVTGVVELIGTVDRPRLEGIVEIASGSFRLPDSRTILSGIDGTILLSSDEAVLDGVGFRLMHGEASATGRIGIRDGQVQVGLAGTVRGLDYPLFPGLIPRLRGTWRLDGPVDDMLLSGDVEVSRATLRTKDEVAMVLLDWFGDEEPPATDQGLRLDVRVEADRTIQAHNPFMNLEGSASLQITGTTSDLGLLGTIEMEEGGELTFQGVRYEIERASVTFTDPLEIDPLIDFQARTWVQSYVVGVRLTGNADRLVPTVTADPPLPESEIYSLLGMGLRDDTLGEGSLGVGVASSLLTRELNSELQRRAQLVLPVDQLRVDPFAESTTGNPAARVTVVKQLSPRWTVILQSNLSSNREEVIVSRWFLGPGLFVEATRDIDGSYALDLKLRRRY